MVAGGALVIVNVRVCGCAWVPATPMDSSPLLPGVAAPVACTVTVRPPVTSTPSMGVAHSAV